MERRQFLQLIPLASLSCSGGIDTPLGLTTDNLGDEISQKTLVNRLKYEPFPTWSPFGEIMFCEDTYLKIIDSEGSDISDIKAIGDNVNKTISHPNWENKVVYQVNNLNNNTSEIWSRHAFSGLSKKLEFDLPEGKCEYPTVSPDNDFIIFTFNNKSYLNKYPPKGEATPIPINEKIGKYCSWVGMYSWSQNGKIAFSAKIPTRGTNIYIMENIENINSITINQLTEGNVHDNNPSWSRYGNYIVFDSNRNTTYDEHEIFLIKSNGNNLETLTNSKDFLGLNKTTSNEINIISPHYTYPRFHPDKNKILYCSTIFNEWGIHLIDNVLS